MSKSIYWADGRAQSAIEMDDGDPSLDLETAAALLECSIDQVNQCRPGEMDAYGVSLDSDPFQRPPGLAR